MKIQRLSDESIAQLIGDNIRTYRLRRNMTQDQVAQETGVSTPTYHKLEKGKASMEVLIATLRALGCLDLLVSLTALPPASPMDALKNERPIRVRATSPVHMKQTSRLTLPSVSGALLIPKDDKNRG